MGQAEGFGAGVLGRSQSLLASLQPRVALWITGWMFSLEEEEEVDEGQCVTVDTGMISKIAL